MTQLADRFEDVFSPNSNEIHHIIRAKQAIRRNGFLYDAESLYSYVLGCASPCETLKKTGPYVSSRCMHACMHLVALFEVSLDPLRALVQEPGDRRSIKLVEKWLQDSGISYDPDALRTWENIVVLRNFSPLHSNTRAAELTSALTFFGGSLPINHSRLWDGVLDKFVLSLGEWQNILVQLPSST
jgi:hypothetical protein